MLLKDKLLTTLGIIGLLLLLTANAHATTQVVQYFTHTPVSVCQPSDSNTACQGSGGGTNYWNLDAGNVGISTTYNVGIATISPQATLHVGYNSNNPVGFQVDSNDINLGTLPSSPNSPVTTSVVGNFSGTNYWQAQQFVLPATANISGYTFSLSSNNNSPSGTMTCQIETDNANSPSGTLANANFTNAISPVASSTNTCSFTMTSQSAGTFWLVEYPTNVQSLGNYWQLNFNAVNSTYYAHSTNGGSSWIVSSGVGNSTIYTLLGNYGAQQSFVVDTNGNVGIGTITPQASLIVVSGNVGIGSTNPSQTLDVNGTIRAIGTNNIILGSDNANYIENSASTGGDLGIYTNSLERMVATNGGNVGIGTPVPPSLLYVAGTTETQGFQLPNNGAGSGNILVSNGVGIGTWVSPSNTVPLFNDAMDAGSVRSVRDSYFSMPDSSLFLPGKVVRVNKVNNFLKSNSFLSSNVLYYNPAKTFYFTLTMPAITANRILNYPLITGTDTLAALAVAQTWTANQAFGTNITMGSTSKATGANLQGLVGKDIQLVANTNYPTPGGYLLPGQLVKTNKINNFLKNQNFTGANFTGNVGIGSVTPGSNLDIQGMVRVTAGYSVGSNVGITQTAITTCGCKQYTGGLCTIVGVCS